MIIDIARKGSMDMENDDLASLKPKKSLYYVMSWCNKKLQNHFKFKLAM